MTFLFSFTPMSVCNPLFLRFSQLLEHFADIRGGGENVCFGCATTFMQTIKYKSLSLEEYFVNIYWIDTQQVLRTVGR